MHNKDNYLYVPRRERLPRVKGIGDKKGYYPMRELPLPKHGSGAEGSYASPKTGRFSVAGKTASGHVQVTYCLPITAPVHVSKTTGKPYSSVFHAWNSKSQPKRKHKAKSKQVIPQHDVYNTLSRGRTWAHNEHAPEDKE